MYTHTYTYTYATGGLADPLEYDFACFAQAKCKFRTVNFGRHFLLGLFGVVCVSPRPNAHFKKNLASRLGFTVNASVEVSMRQLKCQ